MKSNSKAKRSTPAKEVKSAGTQSEVALKKVEDSKKEVQVAKAGLKAARANLKEAKAALKETRKVLKKQGKRKAAKSGKVGSTGKGRTAKKASAAKK